MIPGQKVSLSSFAEMICEDSLGLGSSDQLEIPSTTERVLRRDFLARRSAREVVFASNSRYRAIEGFYGFDSLSRIIILHSLNSFPPLPFRVAGRRRQ
jgi:hypothetical protein